MYVIGKKKLDTWSFLDEIKIYPDGDQEDPRNRIRTTWTSLDPNELDYPFQSLLYFHNRTDAYALLVLLDSMGVKTLFYEVIDVEFAGSVCGGVGND